MIIDAFPFYNELELLEIRLEELKDTVDLFVLVEATETFSGKPKPLYFEENKGRFAAYAIRQIVIPSYPSEMVKPWDREHGTRDILAQVLRDMKLAPSDIVMISDADEIPRASVVRDTVDRLLGDPEGTYYALAQELSYYYVNCKCEEGWTGTRMIRWGDLKTSLTTLRYSGGTLVPDAGWHFSYVGGIERIQDKLAASAHTEYDLPQFKDAAHLEVCLREARDLLGRDARMRFVPLDVSFPKHLVDNRERFSMLIYDSANLLDRGDTATQPITPHAHQTPQTTDAEGGVEALYRAAIATPSDINSHLPFLYRLASTVEHVTEFGTRSGCSTSAFLRARPKRLVAYDLERSDNVAALEAVAREGGVEFEFHERNVLDADIESTDLLFIDTWHVGQQMREELRRHAHKARRFLVMHDTETFAHFGETAGYEGIWPAISEYMRDHPEWRLLEHFTHNNGLTVFTRVQAGVNSTPSPSATNADGDDLETQTEQDRASESHGARAAASAVNPGLRLNLGSSVTRYPGFINVDIAPGPNVDLMGSAVSIPVPDGSVSVLYHNAVFEHVYLRQHGEALAEAARVLREDGVHIGLSIPDFRAIATLYLNDAEGIVGPRFDLFNAYRYTHGEPEQSCAKTLSLLPAQPPPAWSAQLHKSLFDADYLHHLLSPSRHVVFRFRAKGEKHSLNLGFIVSNGTLDILEVFERCCPWAPQEVLEMESVEIVPPSSRPRDMLACVV